MSNWGKKPSKRERKLLDANKAANRLFEGLAKKAATGPREAHRWIEKCDGHFVCRKCAASLAGLSWWIYDVPKVQYIVECRKCRQAYFYSLASRKIKGVRVHYHTRRKLDPNSLVGLEYRVWKLKKAAKAKSVRAATKTSCKNSSSRARRRSAG